VSLAVFGLVLFITRGGEDTTFYEKEIVELHPQGRDAAILELLASAKKAVLIKTEQIEMTEVATAMVNLVRGGVSVTIELPHEAVGRPKDGALARILHDCGVVCRIGLDSQEGYKGTLLIVDGTLLYSASPLSYAPQNSVRPYILGKVKYGSA